MVPVRCLHGMMGAAALAYQRSWELTGTPQVDMSEDLHSTQHKDLHSTQHQELSIHLIPNIVRRLHLLLILLFKGTYCLPAMTH